MRVRVVVLSLSFVTALTVVGCDSAGTGGDAVATQPPERLRTKVLETLPHDRTAFTQGLEISDKTLYEGTGMEGRSSVRAIDVESGKERRRADLPDDVFGEGITVTDSTLWQLTWQNGVAYQRDPKTLKVRDEVSYEGEGWGICHEPERDRLVMSDGSDRLTFRDPETFEPTGDVRVRSGDTPVRDLNELECVDGEVYANVWQTEKIVRIDPADGRVTAEIDASGLLEPAEAEQADVLNGIAAVDGGEAFFVTGKLWPKLFRVQFVPA